MGRKDRLDKFIERKLGSYRLEYVKRMEEKIPAGMLKVIQSYRVTRICLLYTSPSPRDRQKSRMPSSA